MDRGVRGVVEGAYRLGGILGAQHCVCVSCVGCGFALEFALVRAKVEMATNVVVADGSDDAI